MTLRRRRDQDAGRVRGVRRRVRRPAAAHRLPRGVRRRRRRRPGAGVPVPGRSKMAEGPGDGPPSGLRPAHRRQLGHRPRRPPEPATRRAHHRDRHRRRTGRPHGRRCCSAGSTTQPSCCRQSARLPPRQRAVLVLRYFEDLTEAQTAEVLGCSVGTVKSATARAILRLHSSAIPTPHPADSRLVTPKGPHHD